MTMKIKSINPSNEEIIGEVSASSIEEVNSAISTAKESFSSWKNAKIEERIKLLKKLSELLEKEKTNFTELIMREIGKPKKEAETEVLDSQGAIDYYCKKIKEIKEKNIGFDQENFPKTKGSVKFEPHGVIGLITPWNYPLSLPMWTIIPALLTGNTIVYKPSENSVLVGQKIDKIINQVFPKGVFNTIYGDSEIGKILVKSDIDKLFFTGSVEAGQDIIKNIGIKPVALELGGKDSAIICKDADLELAVKGIVWGALNNAGQVCTSTEKVYVSEEIADRFIKMVVKEVKKLRKGVDFGPLANKEQLNKVENHVKQAISEGAKILTGGKKIEGKGFFFEPTVLVNVKEEMEIMCEETFGPIIPIKTVKNEDEAIELTNNSKYGLGATIWTEDIGKGKEIGEKLNVGMIWINDVNLPISGGDYWGGTKLSGLRCSESKLMQCLKAKTFVSYSGKDKRDWWYPYN
jgi:acyl-CoA reductase-like NAD-dependent aldehyde dehydrogenase